MEPGDLSLRPYKGSAERRIAVARDVVLATGECSRSHILDADPLERLRLHKPRI
jgi:hypothetical protein